MISLQALAPLNSNRIRWVTFLLGGLVKPQVRRSRTANLRSTNTKAQQIKCQPWGQAGAVQHRVLLCAHKKHSHFPTTPQQLPLPTRWRIKKQFPHTRTANARKTCDTRHTTRKKRDSNTNKKESKKLGKRKWKKARKLATKDANDLFNRFDQEHM